VLAGSRGLPVLGFPGSRLLALAAAASRAVFEEGFPDRGYTADGHLVPRGEPGALIEDEAAMVAQAVALAPRVASLCLHWADTDDAHDKAPDIGEGLSMV
jgi:UPF0271 protein